LLLLLPRQQVLQQALVRPQAREASQDLQLMLQ
jgi:hypothetical protein